VTVLHVRGVALPGDVTVDLYMEGDAITLEPLPGAETVADGGWLLPGLVDVHSHPGSRHPAGPLDNDTLRADGAADVDAGITLLRTPGMAGPVPPWYRDDPLMPRIISAGAWLASGDRFFDGAGRKVQEVELADAAVEEARANDGWCKIIGDWDRTGKAVPLEIMREIVRAVHGVGGRVAVHCQNADGCYAAVEAGVDSLEHGMHLDPGLLGTMSARGIAWVPTLTPFASNIEFVRARPAGQRRDWFVGGYESARAMIRDAHDAGVVVLAGTDTGPDRQIPGEIRLLAASGLPVETAIGAGSWTAREFLGLSSLCEGAPADIVVYEEDPRTNLDVLDHPTRIVMRGLVIR
jgi:imidazolonepropionase-like amidohydrolase